MGPTARWVDITQMITLPLVQAFLAKILFQGCENVAGHPVQFCSDETKEKSDDVDHTAYPVDSDTRCSRGSKH